MTRIIDFSDKFIKKKDAIRRTGLHEFEDTNNESEKFSEACDALEKLEAQLVILDWKKRFLALQAMKAYSSDISTDDIISTSFFQDVLDIWEGPTDEQLNTVGLCYHIRLQSLKTLFLKTRILEIAGITDIIHGSLETALAKIIEDDEIAQIISCINIIEFGI